jgi:hypothetical protein
MTDESLEEVIYRSFTALVKCFTQLAKFMGLIHPDFFDPIWALIEDGYDDASGVIDILNEGDLNDGSESYRAGRTIQISQTHVRAENSIQSNPGI